MDRREISKVLLVSAAASTLLSENSSAQSCNPPCYAQTQAETDAGVTPPPSGLQYTQGNIRRYGAVANGTTDDSAAVRKALDVAAKCGCRVFCDPAGLIKVNSTIFIPQRFGNEGEKGFLMDFYGCTFRGPGRGIGTIFETGKGTLSTGGTTNFGQPDESSTSLHYGTVIAGARFRECDIAIKLFNFIAGCKLQDLYFEDVDQCVYTDRCFYLELHNCHAQIGSIGASDVLFDFNDVNNAMTIAGCMAAGNSGGTTGTGFRFTGGGSGIIFHNNTAEALARGLVINSAIESIDIRQCYFEALTTTGVDATAAGAKGMDIDGCWFLGTTEAIDAIEWIRGRWSASNVLAGTPDPVKISDNMSMCTVEIPLQILTEAAATAAAAKVPSNYILGPSVILNAPRLVYVAAAGPAAPLALDDGRNLTTPTFAYSGGNRYNGAGYNVPFATQTLNLGYSIIDTQIDWSSYRMAVVFDFYTDLNGSRRLRGLIFGAGFVQRFDSESNITVTTSSNAGRLRLTIAGSAHTGHTSYGFLGQIRHL